jgi:hypothetical protein
MRPGATDDGSSEFVLKRLSRLLADIKQPHSGRIKRVLVKENSPLLSALTLMERPGKPVFRFWQEGPGYDRNLSSKQTVLAAERGLRDHFEYQENTVEHEATEITEKILAMIPTSVTSTRLSSPKSVTSC